MSKQLIFISHVRQELILYDDILSMGTSENALVIISISYYHRMVKWDEEGERANEEK
jgi:hypothetical protein